MLPRIPLVEEPRHFWSFCKIKNGELWTGNVKRLFPLAALFFMFSQIICTFIVLLGGS